MEHLSFSLRPIAVVRSPRNDLRDDFWGDVVAEVEVSPDLPEDSLDGLTDFSHAEIIFVFDRVAPDSVTTSARHPRNNTAWPKLVCSPRAPKGGRIA
jgi:tRNA (Thr-GGU) A37 N-methylase